MFNERAGRGAGGDVAADHLQVGIVLFDPGHAVEHALAVAVGRVDDHNVHAGFDEKLKALFGARTHADGGARKELAFGVLGGKRVFRGLDDVLDGNQATQVEVLVDDENALEAVFVHQTLGVIKARAFLHGHEAIARGHDFAHRGFHAGFKAKVTVGDHAENATAFDHGHAADAVFLAHTDHVADEHVGADGDRVAHDARFMALDLGHFGGLLLGGQILVNDADAAFLRHRDGQIGFGHGVHGGRDHRKIQGDFAGQAGAKLNVAGEDFGVGGDEQNVVKGECLLQETHLVTSKQKKNGSQCRTFAQEAPDAFG